jgi:hypothetical protein
VAEGLASDMRQRQVASVPEVSAWLAEAEGRLLEAIRADEGEQRLRALDEEVEAGLDRWRGRMPPRVLEQLRRESVARRLLEARGLPRLSLFHLEGGGTG